MNIDQIKGAIALAMAEGTMVVLSPEDACTLIKSYEEARSEPTVADLFSKAIRACLKDAGRVGRLGADREEDCRSVEMLCRALAQWKGK